MTVSQDASSIRIATCNECQNQCDDFRQGKIDHSNPCLSCPIGMWSSTAPCRGLGDVVAAIAQPIAKVIDSVAGTNVQGCGGCKKRQEALNKLIPSL